MAFAPPARLIAHVPPLEYGRRGDADHERWQSIADELTEWGGDETTVSKFWRIDCDDDGFTWEQRWPGRKPRVEDVRWDRITRVCWKCGVWFLPDDFYLIDDNADREWVVPSGALVDGEGGHSSLVTVLDRKGLFSRKSFIECQCAHEGETICEENPNAKPKAPAPAPSEPLSYVEAQKAFFRARRDASRNPAAREHQERAAREQHRAEQEERAARDGRGRVARQEDSRAARGHRDRG